MSDYKSASGQAYTPGVQMPWQEVMDIRLKWDGHCAEISMDLSECSLSDSVKIRLRAAAFHKLLSDMLLVRDHVSCRQ